MIRKEIAAGMRNGFQRVLADFMECSPTMEALQHVADTKPLQWATAMNMVAQLAGYHKEMTVNMSQTLVVGNLSDMALLQQLAQKEGELRHRLELATIPQANDDVDQSISYRTQVADQSIVDVTAREVSTHTHDAALDVNGSTNE